MLIDKSTGNLMSNADETLARSRAAKGEPVIYIECNKTTNYVPVEYFLLPVDTQSIKNEWTSNETLQISLSAIQEQKETDIRLKLTALGLTLEDLKLVL